MRDERLNRMWGSKKVTFMRPDVDDEGQEKGKSSSNNCNKPYWFNIFTLYQNRDLFRGSKNCVHESMIPDWMDLVVWATSTSPG
ncbi:hypothetical protein ScalyP_jg4820 [Parmales sp. scaly parma]|nr:hypothetical protein ScalyP_jg4820 [Parmales sp. scaly parma]